MKIKNGFDDKELEIRVGKSSGRTAEMWIKFKVKEDNVQKETLSYITLEELLDLKDEIQKTINKITGVSE
ncbi:MAG: hypothetical protein AAB355_00260 [Patescibacteria group bacterium]